MNIDLKDSYLLLKVLTKKQIRKYIQLYTPKMPQSAYFSLF